MEDNHQQHSVDLDLFFSNFSKIIKQVHQVQLTKGSFIFGETGSGKTTLACYLAGRKLNITKNDDKGNWRFDVDQPPNTSTKIIIGHELTSETIIPNVLAVEGREDIICDSPGFRDTYGISQDIINFYYTRNMIPNLTEARFILSMTDKVFLNRGIDLESNISLFTQLIPQDSPAFDKIADGAVIIVSQTDRNDAQCLNSIKEMAETKTFSDPRVKYLLENCIRREAIFGFKSPHGENPESYHDEKLEFLDRINKTTAYQKFKPGEIQIQFPQTQIEDGKQQFISKAIETCESYAASIAKFIISLINAYVVKFNAFEDDSGATLNKLSQYFKDCPFLNIEDEKEIAKKLGVSDEHTKMEIFGHIDMCLDLGWQKAQALNRYLPYPEILMKVLKYVFHIKERREIILYALSIYKQCQEFSNLFATDQNQKFFAMPFEELSKFIVEAFKKILFDPSYSQIKSEEIKKSYKRYMSYYFLDDEFQKVLSPTLMEFKMQERTVQELQASNPLKEQILKEIRDLCIKGIRVLDEYQGDENALVLANLAGLLLANQYYKEAFIIEFLRIQHPPRVQNIQKLMEVLIPAGCQIYSEDKDRAEIYLSVAKVFMGIGADEEFIEYLEKGINILKQKHPLLKKSYQKLVYLGKCYPNGLNTYQTEEAIQLLNQDCQQSWEQFCLQQLKRVTEMEVEPSNCRECYFGSKEGLFLKQRYILKGSQAIRLTGVTRNNVFYRDGMGASGWFDSIFYVDGTRADGVFEGKFYIEGKYGTGYDSQGAYYVNGNLAQGQCGDNLWYKDGKLAEGIVIVGDDRYFHEGQPANGTMADGFFYNNGYQGVSCRDDGGIYVYGADYLTQDSIRPLEHPYIFDALKKNPKFKNGLLQKVINSRTTNDPRVIKAAANAITILNLAGIDFTGLNLSGIKIPGADLSMAKLDKVNLSGAFLENVNFNFSKMSNVKLDKSYMQGTKYGQIANFPIGKKVCFLAMSNGGNYATVCLQGDLKLRIFSVPQNMYASQKSPNFLPDFQEVQTISGHSNTINSAQFSNDDQYILTSSNDCTAQLFQLSTGKNIYTYEGNKESVNKAEFSKSNSMVVTASSDKTVRIYSKDQPKKCFQMLTGHKGRVTAATFNHQEEQVISVSVDLTIKVWDVDTGKMLANLVGHKDYINDIIVSRDGSYMASGSDDKTIMVWNTQNSQLVNVLQALTAVKQVKFTENSRFLISSGNSRQIKVWDAKNEFTCVANHNDNQVDYITAIAVSNDGTLILSAGTDLKIKAWDNSPLINREVLTPNNEFVAENISVSEVEVPIDLQMSTKSMTGFASTMKIGRRY